MRIRLLGAALLALGLTACSSMSESLPMEPATSSTTTTTAPTRIIHDLYIETYVSSGGKLGPSTKWDYELSDGQLKVTETKYSEGFRSSEVVGTDTIRVSDDDMAELEKLALAFVENPDIGLQCTDTAGIRLLVKDGSTTLQEAQGGVCSSDPTLPAFQLRSKIRDIGGQGS